jgi:hypothetical protein
MLFRLDPIRLSAEPTADGCGEETACVSEALDENIVSPARAESPPQISFRASPSRPPAPARAFHASLLHPPVISRAT